MRRIAFGTMPSRPRRSRRGFTLVELLIVIGIIALLISILLPSLNAARRSADRVACSANLRSMGQAYAQYTSESKGKYPLVNLAVGINQGPNGPWGNPASGPPGAPDGIAIVFSQGYLPDPRILYCPSGEDVPDNDTASASDGSGTRNFTNLEFWAEAKRTGVWFTAPNQYNLTGYAIWANWNDRFDVPIAPPPGDKRQNWFASGLTTGADRILASDHMMRGPANFEAWNGHVLRSRRKVGTTPMKDFPADPTPEDKVNFEGGNVLYNDGSVIWKGTTDTVWRFEHERGFDVFW